MSRVSTIYGQLTPRGRDRPNHEKRFIVILASRKPTLDGLTLRGSSTPARTLNTLAPDRHKDTSNRLSTTTDTWSRSFDLCLRNGRC